MPTMTSPTGPRALPIVGNALAFSKSPLGFFTKLVEEHGDFSRFYLGNNPCYFAYHPDQVMEILATRQKFLGKGVGATWLRPLLGDGLVVSKGDTHRRQRRLAQPAFLKKNMRLYDQTIVKEADATQARFQNQQMLDMDQVMMSMTLNIAAYCFFGAGIKGHTQLISETLERFIKVYTTNHNPLQRFIHKSNFSPRRRAFNKIMKEFDSLIYDLISKRRAAVDPPNDVLTMFLQAQDVEGDGGGMSNTQLRDEMVTMLLAGHETTANALTWTWFLLSQNPEIELRLHEEIDRVIGKRLPNVADVENLPYTYAVFKEAMRLFPPVFALSRLVMEPFEIAGHTVTPGETLFVSQYLTQRDGRWFEDPLEFRPERWLDGEREHPRFSYFPFGGGTRICIGERFAWMEGVLVLATFGRFWRFRLDPHQIIKLQTVVTMRPKYGMSMQVQSR